MPDRGRVRCRGFIESVTYAPANQVASFIAIVVDRDGPAGRSLFAAAQGAPAPVAADTAPPGAAGGKAMGGKRQRQRVIKDRLRVVWLGRRRIPGVVAGTELTLEGMVTERDGLPTMFNPRYELLSRLEDQ